jgi:cytochrome c oxidase subunit 2
MNGEKTFWLPEQASTFTEAMDSVFYGYYYLSLFVLIAITGILIYFGIKYRRKNNEQPAKKQVTHNTTMEVAWTVIPTLIFMVLFYLGWKGYMNMTIAPEDTLNINVVGQKWSWTFNYENGASEDTLVVPVHTDVKLIMYSRDVLHSFYIPAFRTKKDVIPNRYTTLWFNATKEGTYNVFCTEFCGTSHSGMITKVKVVPYEEYEKWVASKAEGPTGTPEEVGAILTKKKGCMACHSIDGSRLVGPSWKGIWGTEREMADGRKVLADENYIRKSIVAPMEDVVAGYAPVMPTYKGQLKDSEIDAIIAYIKSLK